MKKPSLLQVGAILIAAALTVSCQVQTEAPPQTVRLPSTPAASTTAASTAQTDPPVQPVEGDWQWDPHIFDLLADGYQSSAEQLADAILAYEPSVMLGEGAQVVADNFAFEFPPAALVDLTVQGDTVQIAYLYDEQTHRDKLADFERAVEDALNSSIETGDGETVRALMLYRYVVSHVRYFTVDYTDKDVTAFSALTAGVTICYGFADAFGYLLRQTGMEAHLYRGASTSGSEHGWCYAKVDGAYYHFDPTWETSDLKNSGILGLTYFGMNDGRRYLSLKRESECGFGELAQAGVSDGAPDWLLPTGFYPYDGWTYDRETGVLSAMQGSVKLSES